MRHILSRTIFERDELIAKMHKLITHFDQNLLQLIYERKKLCVDLKYGELSQMRLYEELQIIRTSESEEQRLMRSVEFIVETLGDNALKVHIDQLKDQNYTLADHVCDILDQREI